MKTLVLFDFDETLYKKDSLLEFTKFVTGHFEFYIGIFILSVSILKMKLGILTNEKVKQKYIYYFFKDHSYALFTEKGIAFGNQNIEKNLNFILFQKLKYHLEKKHDIYIVTASVPEWIQPWANKYNIDVIGTNIEIKNDFLTGYFSTKNCFGQEKVNRIREIINLKTYEKIIVYGFGKGDQEMLQLAK
jgi:phosphatidylglycerophosphatase C